MVEMRISTVDERQPAPWLWAEILERHVRGGFVDYDGVALDRVLLQGYLARAGESGDLGGWTDRDRIAFWINAYNAATVDLIVRQIHERGGRLKSIQEIPGAWSRYEWTVAARRVSLDDIEHGILRRQFQEPRVHFALVCASRSCPALRSTLYRGRFLDAQLDSAAREFVLDRTRNDFTPRGGRIRISKIFDWYGKDFVGVYHDSTFERLYGPERGAVLSYVARFLPHATVAALQRRSHRIDFLKYDWSLNAPGNE